MHPNLVHVHSKVNCTEFSTLNKYVQNCSLSHTPLKYDFEIPHWK